MFDNIKKKPTSTNIIIQCIAVKNMHKNYILIHRYDILSSNMIINLLSLIVFPCCNMFILSLFFYSFPMLKIFSNNGPKIIKNR